MKTKEKTLYSEDFNFFIQEQIGIVTTNNSRHNKFFSRLDGKVFKVVDDNKKMSDETQNETCKEIHDTLDYYSPSKCEDCGNKKKLCNCNRCTC